MQIICICHWPHGSLAHFVASRHSGLLLFVSRSCAAQNCRSSLAWRSWRGYCDPVPDTLWTEVVALIAAYLIAVVTTPAGISGAVLLLPFQISVLATPSPSVTPTNLL